ncbi:hypothetical protein E4U24_000809 [Claviceps purpurea]|nr:hypothetical protein E4U24_000809 [Claviceps purpurea]
MNPEIWIAIPVSPQALVLSCEKVLILMSDAGTDWLSLPYKLRHCNNTQVPPLAGHPFVRRLHVEDDKTSER